MRAMATAGRAVVFSGTTVAIGLLALVVLPVPFLRSVGYGGMLIPLISVAVAMTCCRWSCPRSGPGWTGRTCAATTSASRSWTRWARLVVRRRLAAAGAAVAVLAALAVAAASITLGPADGNPDTIAKRRRRPPGPDPLERSGIGVGRAARRSRCSRRAPTRGAVAGRLGRRRRRAGRDRAGRRLARAARRPSSTSSPHDRCRRARSTASARPPMPPGPTSASEGCGAAERRLRLGGLRQLPARWSALIARAHVRAARARVPLAAAAAEGRDAERALGRGGVRRDRRSSGSRATARTLWGIPATGAITVLGAADGVRVPVRAVDGLRGVHPRAHARGVRRTGSTDAAVVRGIGRTAGSSRARR